MIKQQTLVVVFGVLFVVSSLGLAGYYATANADIAQLNATSSSLSSAVAALSSASESQFSVIEAQDSSLTSAANLASQLDLRIQSLEQNLSTVQSDLNGTSATLAATEHQLISANANSTSLRTEVTHDRSEIAADQSEIASLTGQISQLQAIENLKNNLTLEDAQREVIPQGDAGVGFGWGSLNNTGYLLVDYSATQKVHLVMNYGSVTLTTPSQASGSQLLLPVVNGNASFTVINDDCPSGHCASVSITLTVVYIY